MLVENRLDRFEDQRGVQLRILGCSYHFVFRVTAPDVVTGSQGRKAAEFNGAGIVRRWPSRKLHLRPGDNPEPSLPLRGIRTKRVLRGYVPLVGDAIEASQLR